MSHKFPLNANFYSILIAIDQELVEIARQKGCFCGGQLHQANYDRSPLGLPLLSRGAFETRFSLCCDTCRKRTTPPSVRFFGRRRYPAMLFLLISALSLGINEYRLSQIKRHFGVYVSESTWKRWRRWWRECFVKKPLWKQARSYIKESQRAITIVRQLLCAFTGNLEDKMLFLLKFLLPITNRY